MRGSETDYLKSGQAAKLLGISIQRVKYLCKMRQIPAKKVKNPRAGKQPDQFAREWRILPHAVRQRQKLLAHRCDCQCHVTNGRQGKMRQCKSKAVALVKIGGARHYRCYVHCLKIIPRK
jgi:hypothetical protein